MEQFQLLGTLNTITSSLVTATILPASGEGEGEFNPVKAAKLGTYVMIYDDGLSIIGSVAAVRRDDCLLIICRCCLSAG